MGSTLLISNRGRLRYYYFYLACWNYLKEQKSFFGEETFIYIMPQERSIGSDNEVDFKLAEILRKKLVD